MEKKQFYLCLQCDNINENESQCPACGFRFLAKSKYPEPEPTNHNSLTTTVLEYLARGRKEDRWKASEQTVLKLERITKFRATKFDEHNEIYYYEDGIYRPNAGTFIREFCRYVLGEAYTEQFANLVKAKIEATNYIEQTEFLKRHDPNLIAVQNGIIDLRNRKLQEFTPEKIFFSKLPITYDPNATCPAIDNFFNEILPTAEDIETIHEFFGYCLIGGYPIQKIVIFLGEGANGKGQTLKLLRRFLGDDNYISIEPQKLVGDKYKESELFNKLANIAGDISDKPITDSSILKGLSGGDTISASKKWKQDIVFENSAKLIFSANRLPKTYDHTYAFFRRWVYINFPYTFVPKKEYEEIPEEQKKNKKLLKDEIIEKILNPKEMSGLMNQALDGLLRLLEAGEFTQSSSAAETEKWWIGHSDSFLAFSKECLVEVPGGYMTKEDLRMAYGKFCRARRLKLEGEKHIKAVLERELNVWDGQLNDENRNRVWHGVNLKEEKPKNYVEEDKKNKDKHREHIGLDSPLVKSFSLERVETPVLGVFHRKNEAVIHNSSEYHLIDGHLFIGICIQCKQAMEIVAKKKYAPSNEGLCSGCWGKINPSDR